MVADAVDGHSAQRSVKFAQGLSLDPAGQGNQGTVANGEGRGLHFLGHDHLSGYRRQGNHKWTYKIAQLSGIATGQPFNHLKCSDFFF
jgi:hypothetical protein